MDFDEADDFEAGLWQALSHHPHLTLAERERLFLSSKERSRVTPRQMLQWVGQTSASVDKLVSAGIDISFAECGRFWLRLYGLFGEVYVRFARTRAFLEKLTTDVQPQPQWQRWLDELKGPLSAIEKAKSCFAPEEALFIKYMRDSEAHVWEDAYYFGLERNNKKKLRNTLTVLGHPWRLEEVQPHLHQIFLRYGLNERAVAVDFARRVQPFMTDVVQECSRYHDYLRG